MTSIIKVDQIQLTDGNPPTAADLGFAAGSVLQVLQSVKSDTFSGADGSWHKITGLTQSITPTSTSSKILVQASVITEDDNNYPPMFHIYRDGTKVTPDGAGSPYSGSVANAFAIASGGINAGAGLGAITLTFSFLDAPSTTSAVEYQIYGGKPSIATTNLVINTTGAGNVGSSTITLMEIAG